MADFIDRALATSHPFANGRYDHENANEHFILGYESYREWLEDLPSACVRPVVRSEWVLNDNRTWSCKRCHSWIPDEQRYYANYCLFCGADMRDDRNRRAGEDG